jgi:serine/threonine-protein kinase RsbW
LTWFHEEKRLSFPYQAASPLCGLLFDSLPDENLIMPGKREASRRRLQEIPQKVSITRIGETMNIRIKNDLSELARTMDLVEAFGREHNLTAKVIHDVNLAIDEIVCNIISYGFDDDLEHEISLVFDVIEDDLVIQIEDEGKEFNPLDAKTPELEKSIEDREIGGLGIHLVRHFMHQIEYTRIEGRNILSLKKKLNT